MTQSVQNSQLIIHVQQIVFCGNSIFIKKQVSNRNLCHLFEMNLNALTNVVIAEFPKVLLGSGHGRRWGAGGVDHVTLVTNVTPSHHM